MLSAYRGSSVSSSPSQSNNPIAVSLTFSNFIISSGAPAAGTGNNGDFYFRVDGTVAGNTILYHKESNAWVAATTA